MQQVDLFAHPGGDDAHLLPVDLLEVFAQPRQCADNFDLTKAVGQLRCSDGVGTPKARREQHVLLVFLVQRVQALEQVEQVLTHARGRLLQEQRVDADSHAAATM